MKAEFLYQYQETNGYTFRSKLFANNVKYNKIGSRFPYINKSNFTNTLGLAKNFMGSCSPNEAVPKLASRTFTIVGIKKQIITSSADKKPSKKIYLFMSTMSLPIFMM